MRVILGSVVVKEVKLVKFTLKEVIIMKVYNEKNQVATALNVAKNNQAKGGEG